MSTSRSCFVVFPQILVLLKWRPLNWQRGARGANTAKSRAFRFRFPIFTFRFCKASRVSAITHFAFRPPPTRQLFVTFRGDYPRDERDVEAFFKNYPRENFHIKLLQNHDAAFVNFDDIRDANDAFQRIHNKQIGRTICDVKYNKPSRSLCIAPIPSHITNGQAIAISTPIFSRFGAPSVKILEQTKRGRSLLVTFEEINAAIVATRELQEYVVENNWKWDIEFYRVKERRNRETEVETNFFCFHFVHSRRIDILHPLDAVVLLLHAIVPFLNTITAFKLRYRQQPLPRRNRRLSLILNGWPRVVLHALAPQQ